MLKGIDGFDTVHLMLNGLGKQAEYYTQGETLKDNVDQSMVFWIKRMAIAAGLPRGFVDGVKSKVEGKEVIVYNDWTGKNGEPLATFFNNGARPHVIEPKVIHQSYAKPGHSHEQIDPPNKAVQHPTTLHFKVGGKDVFAKRVNHPGLPATRVYEAGIEFGESFLVESIKVEIGKRLHWLDFGGKASDAIQ